MLETIGGFIENVGYEAVVALFATGFSIILAWFAAKFKMGYKQFKQIAEALVDLLDTIVAAVEDDKITRAELKSIMNKAKEAVVLFRAGELEAIEEKADGTSE